MTTRKRTVLVPDRNYTNASDGHLPRREVSVVAAPWEEAATRKVAPPKPTGPVLKGPRPGKLKKED